jgi:DNA-binding transcriptional LysR family regulator
MPSWNWDNLNLVLTVARGGGLKPAAAALKIDTSTVFRRLNTVERRFGARLFERLPRGYVPTAAGQRAIDAAERMEAEALELDRVLTGRDERLEGRLRVTCSETIAHQILVPHVVAFAKAHPGVAVELLLDDRVLALSRREADIAIRPTRPSEGDLFGRRLAAVAWAFYGAPAYFKEATRPRRLADLARHRFVGWDEGIAGVQAAQWLARTIPASAIVFRSNRLVVQMAAVAEGIGLALLPCYLGDREARIVRAMPPVAELERELWLVTHEDLKATARVRAFMDLVGARLVADKALFEGGAARKARPT